MAEQPAPPALKGFHHVAFRCRDAAETRRFYEGVLGLPLAAALAFDEISGTNTPLRYLHIFFRLGDGSYLAFFDAPDSARDDHFRRASGFNRHVAIEAGSLADLETFKSRLDAHGIEHWGPLDHGFVKSLYFYDPNGLNVEITARAARHDAILAEELAMLEDQMRAWSTKK